MILRQYLPSEDIGVRESHFRAHRCSINLSVVLSVESESVVCEDHTDEITESGCLNRGIYMTVKKFAAGLYSVLVRYVGIK